VSFRGIARTKLLAWSNNCIRRSLKTCIRGRSHPSTSPGAAWRGRTFREGAFMSLTLLLVADALTNLNRRRVLEFAATHRIPAIYELDFLVRDGGLMSYGQKLDDAFRRAAFYVDRILKGAKPGDLPVEQPTRYYLFINLKTAKALGLTIPQTILLRADQVIE